MNLHRKPARSFHPTALFPKLLTRDTAKRLASHLGVDEPQAIHYALHELAVRVLPQYEADDGALTAKQIKQIKKRVPQGTKRSVKSSLVDLETT